MISPTAFTPTRRAVLGVGRVQHGVTSDLVGPQRFTIPGAQVALSAAAGTLLGLLRQQQRHPGCLDEGAADLFAGAVLRLLRIDPPEAARLVALPLPSASAG